MHKLVHMSSFSGIKCNQKNSFRKSYLNFWIFSKNELGKTVETWRKDGKCTIPLKSINYF